MKDYYLITDYTLLINHSRDKNQSYTRDIYFNTS